jgi:hypothetical protein
MLTMHRKLDCDTWALLCQNTTGTPWSYCVFWSKSVPPRPFGAALDLLLDSIAIFRLD